MPVFAAGLSHHHVSANDLTHFTSCAEKVAEQLCSSHGIHGLITLATCNRCELYIDAEDFHQNVRLLRDLFTEAGAGNLAPIMDIYGMRHAIQHLFEVSCGLDSMVIGESEIAGQVKKALNASSQHQSPALHRLFQMALSTSKSVAGATSLDAMGRSVASVSIDLAEKQHGDLLGKEALIVGTGAYAGVVTADLIRRGAHVSVYSSSGRAKSFARTHPVTPIFDSQLASTLHQADILIACSGRLRGSYQITSKQVQEARRDSTGILTIIDLALGRDVSPDLARVPGIHLIDLDVVGQHTPKDHVESIAHAEQMIQLSVEGYLENERARMADPAILAIRSYIEEAFDHEMKIAATHNPPEQTEAIKRSLRRLTNALLHAPTVLARQAAATGDLEEFLSALKKVSGIEVKDD